MVSGIGRKSVKREDRFQRFLRLRKVAGAGQEVCRDPILYGLLAHTRWGVWYYRLVWEGREAA